MKRFFLILLLTLAVLVIALVIFVQTPICKNWLKNKLVETLETNFNGQVEVGAIRGNPFSQFQIENLEVTVENQPLIKFKNIYLRYSLPSLLAMRLKIKQLILESPKLFLHQNEDSSWNFSHLIKEATSDTSDHKNQTEGQIRWTIIAPDIQIKSAAVNILYSGEESWQLPKKIRNLNLGLGCWLTSQGIKVALENLSFVTLEPDFVFRADSSELNYGDELLQVSDLSLRTGASYLTADLNVENFDDPTVQFRAKGDPLSLDEMHRFLPELQLNGNLRFEIKASGPLDNLQIQTLLQIGSSKLNLAGKIQANNTPTAYDLNGEVSHLNLAEILNRPDLLSDLNFIFNIEGTGWRPGKMDSKFQVEMNRSSAFGYVLDDAKLAGDVNGDSLDFTLDAQMASATADFSGSVLARDDFNYHLKGQIENLDVDKFFVVENLTSDLNLDVDFQGHGKTKESISGILKLYVLSSSLNEVPLDSGTVQFVLKAKGVEVKNLQLTSPLGRLCAKGDFSFDKKIDFIFNANFEDFSVLSNVLEIDSLDGRGELSGHLRGRLDSLEFAADLNLQQLATESLSIAQLFAKISGTVLKNRPHFQMNGHVLDAVAYGVPIDTMKIWVEQNEKEANFKIDANQSERFRADVQGSFRAENSAYQIALDVLNLNYFDQHWQLQEDPKIIIQDSNINLSKIKLVNGEQVVTLTGCLDIENENRLTVLLSNFDLSQYGSLFSNNGDLVGNLDFEFHLSEKLNAPNIKTKLTIADGQYSNFTLKKFTGHFDYADDFFRWNCILSKTESDSSLESYGLFPMTLSLVPFEYELYSDEPLQCKINTGGLDLSFLQAFSKGIKNIQGVLVTDMVVRSSLDNLQGEGFIEIKDGEFSIPELGTRYEKVKIRMELKKQQIDITDFHVESGGGQLEIIEGGLSLSQTNLEEFNARFKAKDFQFMNNKKMQAKVKGEVMVSGSVQSPYFSGDLIVTEARMNYQEWFEEQTAVELTKQPIFVIASDSTEFDTTGAMRFQKSKKLTKESFTDSKFWKNLTGELSIDFPRNSWFRSSEATIEVEGNVVIVKEGPEFTLFGSFASLRGFYELLGNRFRIERGELVFLGDADHNPEVAIEASYQFKDFSSGEPVTREFRVFIGGTLFFPEFRFTVDEQEAKQQDVLSILLFGQSFGDLSFSQRSGVSKNTGFDDRAASLLTGQVLRVLSGRLGQSLNLDVIQIESGSSFEDAKVRVGKYVTPDVFVSISQDFGAEGNQKVELEYEIPKKILFFNLLLQASSEKNGNSALDLVWKIEW